MPGQDVPSTSRSPHHLLQPGNRHPVHRPPQVKCGSRLDHPCCLCHRTCSPICASDRVGAPNSPGRCGSDCATRNRGRQWIEWARGDCPGQSWCHPGSKQIVNAEREPPTPVSDFACRAFSPPASHVSRLRREYGQTACRQRSAQSARSTHSWRTRTALDRLAVSRETSISSLWGTRAWHIRMCESPEGRHSHVSLMFLIRAVIDHPNISSRDVYRSNRWLMLVAGCQCGCNGGVVGPVGL